MFASKFMLWIWHFEVEAGNELKSQIGYQHIQNLKIFLRFFGSIIFEKLNWKL